MEKEQMNLENYHESDQFQADIDAYMKSDEYREQMSLYYDQASKTEMKFKTREASLAYAVDFAAIAGREVRPEEVIQIASVFEAYLSKP